MSKAWSSKEDDILVRLGNRGNRRRMRTTYLKHKTAKQCAERWKNIQGYIDRPFAPFECNKIRYLYRLCGPRWGRISAVLHRSPQMCMECWLSLKDMDEEAARIRGKMAVQRLLS
ncbi:2451_t:CDS:2 [Paraglomus brasilianum]|uniref:2451_t:CDS:1 n=1 Tax=Paraglomus brasilianum TaxID=144538 RepID=A0A9N8ZVL2_9GLOM|nr:2451_t:CDS:2 [Paraglomus brasilianum]